MDGFRRYGLYYVPERAFYRMGAEWLGWDSVEGKPQAHPEVPGLPGPPDVLTATPRKYGFHGTVKPPFRLATGKEADALTETARDFCAGRPPVEIPRMEVRRLGGFVAVVPAAPSPALADLAAAAVEALDAFRAPPREAELARRRKARLTEAQEALLARWGYPYVMEEFRFHLTLTGRLAPGDADAVRSALDTLFAPVLADPITIDSLCLVGEDDAGRFHVIHRYTLAG